MIEIGNEILQAYLKKRLDQPTVILSFKILLDLRLQTPPKIKASKTDIEKVFNKKRLTYGVQTFRRDYVMRQSSNKDNAIEQTEDQEFYIRENYLEGISPEQTKSISDFIESYYHKKNEKKEKFIAELRNIASNELDAIKEHLYKLLTETETEKRGQVFEITAYAILKTFYDIRGFRLNRFSTVYANDGGVDYSGQEAIYQVTTKLDARKLDEDINKAPGIKRVLVFKETVKDFDLELLEHELVLDYVDTRKLASHLDYLFDFKADTNSKTILDTIINEFNREFYFSS